MICTAILAYSIVFAFGETGSAITYNRDIRPILSDKCFFCHGPDSSNRQAELRLDQRDSAVNTQAIVPGAPTKSRLIERIFANDTDTVMPPPESHKNLSEAEKILLREWIAQGAVYEQHWAFRPLTRPVAPGVGGDSTHNPIDQFVMAELKKAGIAPAPRADSERLLRRLAVDLTGLPPSTAEREKFLHSNSKYEEWVDYYLNSPHFGEQQAQHWLDVVRYADTVGFHGDQNIHVYPYRDYVITSFNQNIPFSDFTREQLAGDLVPQPTDRQLIATAFNRLNMVTREGGAQPGEYLAKYAADRVRTVGMAWLGLTTGCAECHDHKFDPFTAHDFYSMAAFFQDVKQWGVYSDYAYTPNPDLRGWSNDHPFPPEKRVFNPASRDLAVRYLRDADELAATVIGRANLSFDRERWSSQMNNFLKLNPRGWIPLTGSTQDDDSQVQKEKKNEKKNATRSVTLRYVIPDGVPTIAALQLRLFPTSSPITVRVRARVMDSTGKIEPKALSFHWATGAPRLPQYSNGSDVITVHRGWRLPSTSSYPVSVYDLEHPVSVQDSSLLELTIEGYPNNSLEVLVSPLASMKATTESTDWTHRNLRSLDDNTNLLYMLSSTQDAQTQSSIQDLLHRAYQLNEGWVDCVITERVPPKVTRVLPRGNWQDETGPIVQPALPAFLTRRVTEPSTLNRRHLADWLVNRNNPLTSRVIANRLWKQFFAQGLCLTPDDLGAQGDTPIHLSLLDWLAVDLVESGWNIKRFIKQLVMSSTYQRDSRPDATALAKDPQNRLLSFLSPRRLEAESIRDHALAASGLLDRFIGGPSVFPYQPPNYYANIQFPNRDYVLDRSEQQYRRGLYMHWQRTFLHPMLANFDAPSREECTAARSIANTPQQALTLLNDPSFAEAARSLAHRSLAEKPEQDSAARLRELFIQVLSRQPNQREIEALDQFLKEQEVFWKDRDIQAQQLVHLPTYNRTPRAKHPAPTLAAWVQVARTLLNLQEVTTRY